MAEVEITKALDHPNVITLYHTTDLTQHLYRHGASLVGEPGYRESWRQCRVPQRMNYVIVWILQKDEAYRLKLFKQLVCVLQYCHEERK